MTAGVHCRFTYVPPRTEDRALLFDTEIRGQMAMLMGGRAAEELTCSQVTQLFVTVTDLFIIPGCLPQPFALLPL